MPIIRSLWQISLIMFYIGEGETVYFELLDCYKENKKKRRKQKRLFRESSQIEGIYVPAFYDVEYNEDGTLKKLYTKLSNCKGKDR